MGIVADYASRSVLRCGVRRAALAKTAEFAFPERIVPLPKRFCQ